MSLKDKMDDKIIADEIAGVEEEDEAAVTLVRALSISNAKAEKESAPSSGENSIPMQTQRSENADPLVHPRVEGDSAEVTSDANGKGSSETKREISRTENNRYTTKGARPVRISMQEEPFHKSRVPRKSVLKHSNRPIARVPSTYDSTTPSSPPSSPSVNSSAGSDGTKSPTPQQQYQQDKKPCCVVM